jgi:hypothetical protein
LCCFRSRVAVEQQLESHSVILIDATISFFRSFIVNATRARACCRSQLTSGQGLQNVAHTVLRQGNQHRGGGGGGNRARQSNAPRVSSGVISTTQGNRREMSPPLFDFLTFRANSDEHFKFVDCRCR